MKYVALLRGINVGGNRKVPMAELKQCFASLGFQNIESYINSGNIVFSSTKMPSASKIEQAIEAKFGFLVPTLVLDGTKIIQISEAIPESWINDSPNPEKTGQKSDVLYLFDEINSPDVLEKFGYRPEHETMKFVDGAVLSSITRKNQSKSALLKIAGTSLYKNVTIRNITTAKKLAEMVKS